MEVWLAGDVMDFNCSAFLSRVSALSKVEQPLSSAKAFNSGWRPRTNVFHRSGSLVPVIWNLLMRSLAYASMLSLAFWTSWTKPLEEGPYFSRYVLDKWVQFLLRMVRIGTKIWLGWTVFMGIGRAGRHRTSGQRLRIGLDCWWMLWHLRRMSLQIRYLWELIYARVCCGWHCLWIDDHVVCHAESFSQYFDVIGLVASHVPSKFDAFSRDYLSERLGLCKVNLFSNLYLNILCFHVSWEGL